MVSKYMAQRKGGEFFQREKGKTSENVHVQTLTTTYEYNSLLTICNMKITPPSRKMMVKLSIKYLRLKDDLIATDIKTFLFLSGAHQSPGK